MIRNDLGSSGSQALQLALNSMLESAWITGPQNANLAASSGFVTAWAPHIPISAATTSFTLSQRIFGEDGSLIRTYPVGGGNDTMMGRVSGGKIVLTSMHCNGTETFMDDAEIAAVIMHPYAYQFKANSDSFRGKVPYGLTFYGRHVFKQHGFRGCGAGVATMFLMDHGKKPDWDFYSSCNLSDPKLLQTIMKHEGLRTSVQQYHFKNNATDKRILARVVRELGPIIVSSSTEIGGHFYILDYFDPVQDVAVMRDPFHGMALAVGANELYGRSIQEFIAVEKQQP